MRKIVFLLIIVVSLCECERDNNRLANWTKIYEGLFYFSSVCFPNSDTGYVIGGSRRYSDDAVVIKTIDGGTSWKQLTLPEASMEAISSIYFTDANIGFIGGLKQDRSAIILKTINGGDSWMILNLPNEEAQNCFVHSVYFTDAINGFAASSNGVIFKTIDGGNTWTVLVLSIEDVDGLTSIYFIDSNIGYALGLRSVGNFYGTYFVIILKTIDGGTTWSASLDNSSYGRLYSVCFTDAKTGYAVGRDGNLDLFHGIIYKTSDGGITWTDIWRPLNPIEDSSLQSVYFIDSNMGYAVGSNLCLKTINGGMTWSNLDVPEGLGGLMSVYFTNSTTGFIVTSNGIILKTSTGGK